MNEDHQKLIILNKKLLNNIQIDDYSGYDPFDFLNSSVFKASPFRHSQFARLAWLQIGKRSPINFRPLVGVPKMRNPKGLALLILGMIEDFKRTGDNFYLKDAENLGKWLIDNSSDLNIWESYCWGYHFDWQARAFFVPAGKPNMITTCYVARALYSLGIILENKQFVDSALNAAEFISNHLFISKDDKQYYAYIPGESAFVHNASLWGAAWCGFVGDVLGDNELKNQAISVARQSVSEQNKNGSWVYGSRHHHNFIDGFHTGYNLEALKMLAQSVNTSEFDSSISKGYDFYINNFFDNDGTAKYYDNSTKPIDMHSFSQAIFTLLKIGGEEKDIELCKKVVNKSIDLLYLEKRGRFSYQKGSFIRNNVNYSRWTQAWSYFSLAYFNRVLSKN